jgi:ubiquinone/menaquinone biosynthesis C-methylase UbiE
MKSNKNQLGTKESVPELFSGTYEYYAKYRPGIPEEVISIIVKYFGIKPSDRILDIGCGTGQVVLAMEGKCGEMVCLDSDLKMLEQAKKATKDSEIKLVWINRGSQDLRKIKKNQGTFKIATICRAFHWMDREQVLRDLNDLIDEEGGIAIFGDGSFWTGQEDWQQIVKKVVQKYLGEERRAGKNTFKESSERWENIVRRSPFRFVKIQDVAIVRYWNVESIIGYLFSTSFAAPHLFGDQLHRFKQEVETTLLTLNPKGVFQENAVWSMVLGSKKPR